MDSNGPLLCTFNVPVKWLRCLLKPCSESTKQQQIYLQQTSKGKGKGGPEGASIRGVLISLS